MKITLTPVLFAILFACVCASSTPARAQAARNDTTTTIGGRRVTISGTVPRTDASAAASTHISSASSAILSGFKYQPPPPPKPDDEVDLRDIDKPKNEIIRLPKMTVTAKKPAVFTDRTLYTQDQLKKLAMSRYLTTLDKKLLNKWTFASIGLAIGTSNEDRAMQMYLDDERLQNMSAMQQQIFTAQAAGNTNAAQQMKSQYYDMFLRPQDTANAAPASLAGPRGQ
jgi:hypothetical protein